MTDQTTPRPATGRAAACALLVATLLAPAAPAQEGGAETGRPQDGTGAPAAASRAEAPQAPAKAPEPEARAMTACGFTADRRLTLYGYGPRETRVPFKAAERLEDFVPTAKAADRICILAEVGAQDRDDQASELIGARRALEVKNFLASEGVPLERMEIAPRPEAIRFFGLLPDDPADDRRVLVAYDGAAESRGEAGGGS